VQVARAVEAQQRGLMPMGRAQGDRGAVVIVEAHRAPPAAVANAVARQQRGAATPREVRIAHLSEVGAARRHRTLPG